MSLIKYTCLFLQSLFNPEISRLSRLWGDSKSDRRLSSLKPTHLHNLYVSLKHNSQSPSTKGSLYPVTHSELPAASLNRLYKLIFDQLRLIR